MKAFPRAAAENQRGEITLARLPKTLGTEKNIKENSRREETKYELGHWSLIFETL